MSSSSIGCVYQDSIVFLKQACAPIASRREVSRLQQALDSYLLSIPSENKVDAIVRSLGCRKLLLELSSELDLSNDLGLRNALRTDEQRIILLLVAIFGSKAEEEVVLGLKDDSAQYFLDVVQDAIDKGYSFAPDQCRMARRIIRKLSEACDKLPSSLFITGVTGRDVHPTCGGGFADVYRASYDNKTVALKHMRHFHRGANLRRLNLKFCREALVWKDLHHPYILPFIGIDRDSFPSSLCMVSPWMEHGTVLKYLEVHGHSNVDKLLFEIAQGLQYLHSRNIVHGDLRGANILINEDWSACLSDFGLSSFTNTTISRHTSTRSGSIYWMAPELIAPEQFGVPFSRTPASDVYAFACVCIELYTGRRPFAHLTEAAAMFAILGGKRPERPSGVLAMSDTLWKFVSEYWSEKPAMRPSTRVVAQNMALPVLRQQKALPPLPDPLLPVSEPSSSDTFSLSSRDDSPALTPSTPENAVACLDPSPSGPTPTVQKSLDKQPIWKKFTLSLALKQDTHALNEQLDQEHVARESELSSQIGYLVATACEDRAAVTGVCEAAFSSESNAHDAVRALRRIFKYGTPFAQLAAARLWAIMLRSCSEAFIFHSSSRKFLETMENVILSPDTSPVVRERFLDVVGAAVYVTQTKKEPGFRVLWKRIKPSDKPDEGYPFDTTDPLLELAIGPFIDETTTAHAISSKPIKVRRPKFLRVISPEEDIRRLFQECKIARGNATLLKDALGGPAAFLDADRKDIILEFHQKCIQSHQLIFSQIPWATAEAQRSCGERDSTPDNALDGIDTCEERLLADLLYANEQLVEALALYDGLDPTCMEQFVETAALVLPHENEGSTISVQTTSSQSALLEQEMLESEVAIYQRAGPFDE